mmetsp:Transcript_31148/g.62050  ORF Transcript_31148/g.62050 Transcript_31148/m.62050 type:complete len:206 (-) Transcript_31148:428-1045(-)|eukprot:CAMPEP_0171329438 /NCGR_PEP_ID=MMETSP0878-20121228/1296_1 /TAXON_ID=67004 /ORGANISM="Thalassiosira weissflogii, Strain CCMP1336" /LENGTH=205 /DNA_ID=CAMNT_0011829463 /DNA_START=274 /DNA_END=891 /DNA_ORIENTATION=+
MKSSTLIIAATTASIEGFAFNPSGNKRMSTVLQMGLFDGVKEAFGAEGMGPLDGDRETPIDRWMGWNTKPTNDSAEAIGAKAPENFVDSMDAANYVTTALTKPMGIVFEENDSKIGGIFVLEINEGSSAAADGKIKPGDQLVAVGSKKVSGLQFEDALGAIIDSEEEKTKLTFFRGPSQFLYGPAGASQEWLDEFIAGGVEAKSA